MIDLFSGHFLETSLQGRIGWIGKLESKNGKQFLNFSVACHIHKTIEWVHCIAYQNKAELIDKFAMKGTVVSIRGYNKTSTWQDDDTNKKRSRTSVIVKEVGFISNTKNEYSSTTHTFDISEHELNEEESSRAIQYAKTILEEEGYQITKNREEN
ncbi:single-stranded DNA-binding protein [Francisella philomiragia]|uniref:single-stranded DNA-binding protein n=1 Tax=Francisella philomiragia TaxID=28110 RepID=UPI0019071F99|nr:single-stranded DNA-binding protein [Francisella philomiragia]MBK2297317.1 single-stranded DNA-binding protein [Francisella philomiragia]